MTFEPHQQPHTRGYNPKGSGMLAGGGGARKGRRRILPKGTPRGATIAFGVGTGNERKDILARVPEFDPRKKYSGAELILLAEKMLIEGIQAGHDIEQHPAILFEAHMRDRLKREIYVASGTPDPDIVSGLYWRTHPQGRTVSSPEQRAKGSSYYR